jgi:hypothetical protein
MRCTSCKTTEATERAVINGTYYPNICAGCRESLTSGQSISSGHARWARSIDAEDHEMDIQQPFNKDGTPNRRFVRAYPEQARAVMTEDQMRKAE